MMTDSTDPPAITDDSFLDGQIAIHQPLDGYRVGTDAVMLGAAISASNLHAGNSSGNSAGRCLDMGAGVGAVSLSVLNRYQDSQITLIEKDSLCAKLAEDNLAQNGHAENGRVITGDVQNMPVILKASFDQVFSNPPFHHPHDKPASSRRRTLAHYGDGSTLDGWVSSALWALKPKGRLSMIIRADRTDEMLAALRIYGAGEALVFPLYSTHGSPATRVIITARKQVKGAMALLSGLVLHHAGGGQTEEARKIMTGAPLMLTHPATRHLTR